MARLTIGTTMAWCVSADSTIERERTLTHSKDGYRTLWMQRQKTSQFLLSRCGAAGVRFGRSLILPLNTALMCRYPSHTLRVLGQLLMTCTRGLEQRLAPCLSKYGATCSLPARRSLTIDVCRPSTQIAQCARFRAAATSRSRSSPRRPAGRSEPGCGCGTDVERFHLKTACDPSWASLAAFGEPDVGDVVNAGS